MGAPAVNRPLVGLVIPSSNPTVERFVQWHPAAAVLGVDFVATRLAVRTIGLWAESDGQFEGDQLARAAGLLGDVRPQLVVWAGTSGLWRGAATEDHDLDAMAAAAGCPATSSRVAVLAALSETDGPVAVLTPYVAAVHEAVIASVVAAGYEVPEAEGLGISDNLAFSRIDADRLTAAAVRLSAGGSRRVMVACTNLVVASGRVAVVDSLLATLWHAAVQVGGTAQTYASFYESVCDEPGRPGRPRLAAPAQPPIVEVRSRS